MTQQHPISGPSPELAAKWVQEIYGNPVFIPLQQPMLDVINRAAQWGADTELEACCELTRDNDGYDAALGLRASRRPKPPSLKEQALEALERFSVHAHAYADEMMADFDLISRALEQLDD
jgi:hypothetical protein